MLDSLDGFCGSKFWDANLTWYTNNPELTRCFEWTVLVWSPLIFFWLFLPIDLFFTLRSKSRDIPFSWKNVSKLIINSLLIVICLFDLIIVLVKRCQGVELHDVDVSVPAIRLVNMVSCFMLIILHKKFGQMSSGLLCTFWFVISIIGIPEFRTDLYSYQDQKSELPALDLSYLVFYCLCVVMFFLNILSDDRPAVMLYPIGDKACPERSASFPSRVMFSWFDRLALLGYKRPLLTSDLWELNPGERSLVLLPEFDGYWEQAVCSDKQKRSSNGTCADQPQKSNEARSSSVSVLGPLFKAFGLTFIAGAVMQLFQDLFVFISPQILKLLIGLVESRGQPVWKGYLYVITLVGSSVLQSLLNGQCQQKMFLVGLHARTCLISSIYRKALRISSGSRKESTMGEIVNLMAVDAQRVMDVMTFINLIWSGPFQIALCIYFLWQILGVSSLAGLAVMILLIPLNGVVVGKMKTLQVKQMKNKDERVKMMNEILSGIKVLKLYAWEGSFEEQVQRIRKKEIEVLKSSAYLNAAISFIWACAPQMVSLVTFAVFVLIDKNNILDAQTAFVSLALFNILRLPLVLLPYVIMITVQTAVSLKRITKFLSLPELSPTNVTHNSEEVDSLVVKEGEFRWDYEESGFILKDINLRVPPGGLVAVVGSVGSGKTSLLSAILGEMEKIKGYVNTKGSIAYVPQIAWIRNATLRDNITFGKTFKEKNYKRIIESCALLSDFQVLPAGDQTEIGEKGINLSGGQKQRVSLARAVYHDSDIYLLDDPLSAVDSHVGKHIFENVIGPTGILRNKTRVLVTHSITYLPVTDVIVVLKEGTITEVGSYKQLLNQKGEFSQFVLSHIQQDSPDDTDDPELEDARQVLMETHPELRGKLTRRNSRQISESSITASHSTFSRQSSDLSLRSDSLHSDGKAAADPLHGLLIEEERAETGGVKWSVYLYYLKSVGLALSIGSLALNTAYQGISIGSNVWLSEWSSDVSIYVNGTYNTARRDMYLEGYAGFAIVQIFLVIGLAGCLYLGALRAALVLHNRLLHNMLRVASSFFDVTPLGRIMNRFSADVDTLDNTLPHTLRSAMGCLFQVVGTLAVISYSTPIFLAVIIPLILIYYFIQRFYVATSRQLMRLESVSRSPIYSHFGESVTGTSSIRAFNLQNEFILESQQKVDLNQVCYYPSLVAARWLAVRLELMGTLIVFFSSLFAVLAKDWISPGIVGLSVSYALQITEVLSWAVQMAATVETNVVAVERIKEYSETPQEAAWETERSITGPLWPEEGRVEFRDFSVRYRQGLDLVLKGISFVINGGEKVGIVGRTGAGKSSLTLSLFRIIEADSGSILIDNVDISQLGLHELRARLTIIPQDPVLFSGSVRMNLDPFCKHSDDELWRALELAHLKHFVKNLPACLQHQVTEAGENLSVGQRQLICLGRALLRKTKVLILDEATAAVDLETDDLIQKTIRSQFSECTVLTIAHRINTIMDSDRVIVLDKGTIAEFDSPSNLLKSQKSIFYGMARDAGLI